MEIFEGRQRRGLEEDEDKRLVGMEEDPNRGLRKIMKRRKWTWATTLKHWRGSTLIRHEVLPKLLQKHNTTVQKITILMNKYIITYSSYSYGVLILIKLIPLCNEYKIMLHYH